MGWHTKVLEILHYVWKMIYFLVYEAPRNEKPKLLRCAQTIPAFKNPFSHPFYYNDQFLAILRWVGRSQTLSNSMKTKLHKLCRRLSRAILWIWLSNFQATCQNQLAVQCQCAPLLLLTALLTFHGAGKDRGDLVRCEWRGHLLVVFLFFSTDRSWCCCSCRPISAQATSQCTVI